MATFAADDDRRHTDLDSCQEEVDGLRAMLRSRPAIEQAKGILMAQHGCTPDEAFQMISEAAQRDNRKVRELAESIVASAQGSAESEQAS
jgi:AmiR/NasT family two-component response regulator